MQKIIPRTSIIILAALCLWVSHFARTDAYGQPAQMSSRLTDSDPQLTLEEALEFKEDEVRELQEALKLSFPFDISTAFDDGTLLARAKALTPLEAKQNVQGIKPIGITKDPKASWP